MPLCSRNFPVPEIQFLRFLSPDISEPDSRSPEVRSGSLLSRTIGRLRSLAREMRSMERESRSRGVSTESVDVCAVRLFTIVLLVAVVLSANLIVVHAQPRSASAEHSTSALPQTASAEHVLFEAANRERAAQGLAQLRWDDALANAARAHALLMAQRNTLSHQFAGEAALQNRARVAGARFTEIAENVAEGPAAEVIHASWMHSPPHRANLLDPELTAIGIAVVGSASREGAGSAGNGAGNRSGDVGGRAAGTLFAVEDFSQPVASLSLVEQEGLVGAALAARGLQVANFTGGASNHSGSAVSESDGFGGSGASAVDSGSSVSGTHGSGSNVAGTNGSGSLARGSSASAGFTNASASVPSNTVGLGQGGSGSMRTNSNAVVAISSNIGGTTEDARKTCEMERGWAGGRPGLVVRYETGDLNRLPGDLEQKIQTSRYRVAAVGACQAGNSQGFTRFRVAVLLY